MSVVVKVLQYLLLERVPIRNLRTVCEALAELAPEDAGPARRWSPPCASRSAAASCKTSADCARNCPSSLWTPRSSRCCRIPWPGGGSDGAPGFEPGLADRIQQSLADSTRRQEAAGEPAVLLVAPKIRPWVARLMRYSSPTLSVLAYNEIPESRRIRVIAAVGR